MVGDDGTEACRIVLDYGELEAEYAALRRGVAMFDRTDRTVVEVAGPDAADLLDRLVTNKMLDGVSVMEAFVLERTGRIVVDARLIRLGERTLVDLDRTDVGRLVEILDGFVFAEDVRIVDGSDRFHRIDSMGPDAPATVEHAMGAGVPGGGWPRVDRGSRGRLALEPGENHRRAGNRPPGRARCGRGGLGGALVAPALGRRQVRPIG